MTCQFCDAPATVTLTKIVAKHKHKVHLCDRCAGQKQLFTPGPGAAGGAQVNAPAVLGVFDLDPAPAGAPEAAALTCPDCGLQYGEFRATGRLGCPAEYDAFRPALEPLLARIHRADAHAGKTPRAVRAARRGERIQDLRRRMAAAARDEDYEEAARLRDAVRQEEAAE
jgi:protein arginine kinase activator